MNRKPDQWKSKRTPETSTVEAVLREAGFLHVDAYRFNAASIRVRVIDPRFEGLTDGKRDAMIEPILEELPDQTRSDIISLFTFAPSELEPEADNYEVEVFNTEFERPSRSYL